MNLRQFLKEVAYLSKTLEFKIIAQKDMRKYSNIVEGSIRRYVQNKI